VEGVTKLRLIFSPFSDNTEKVSSKHAFPGRAVLIFLMLKDGQKKEGNDCKAAPRMGRVQKSLVMI